MNGSKGDTINKPKRTRKWRNILLSFTVVVILVISLFVAAGSLNWIWGWVLAGIMVLNKAVSLFFLDPGLVEERTNIRQGYKSWDILLSTIMGRISPFAIIVVSGLDYRFSWSSGFPSGLQISGAVLLVLAYALILWAMRINKFFSAIIRIQKDRGHHVIATGPYRTIRHPGYLGTIMHTISLALVLGSYWSFVPTFIALIFCFIRTVMEDNTLKRELEGYDRYAEKVRYRLVPGLW
jgi:protein-S-isoprenylcysteine O-methyltransferase Ste14